MDSHVEIIRNFFEFGQCRSMDSLALEKAIIGILAVMASYRANPGKELDYLHHLAEAADDARKTAGDIWRGGK